PSIVTAEPLSKSLPGPPSHASSWSLPDRNSTSSHWLPLSVSRPGPPRRRSLSSLPLTMSLPPCPFIVSARAVPSSVSFFGPPLSKSPLWFLHGPRGGSVHSPCSGLPLALVALDDRFLPCFRLQSLATWCSPLTQRGVFEIDWPRAGIS